MYQLYIQYSQVVKCRVRFRIAWKAGAQRGFGGSTPQESLTEDVFVACAPLESLMIGILGEQVTAIGNIDSVF
jgi:hypothetical protein